MLDNFKKTLRAAADKLKATMDTCQFKHLALLGLFKVKAIAPVVA